ncbi:MAG: MFS transporter [Nitrospinaceae bacterium]
MSYLDLLKTHRPFRSLWYGQVVSELGDWLNSIAIYALILQLSGTGMAMAGAMMAKLLPIFLVSPVAGVVVDRMSRKKVMIITDILRCFIVLGLLWVEDAGDLWLLYSLVVLEIAMAGFFEPARSAIIPSLIPRKNLVTANALSGSTWSVMLAFGAALGGAVVSLLGIRAAFILDAMTFLVSAAFILRIPSGMENMEGRKKSARQGGFKNLIEGGRYLISEPIVMVLALLKSGLAVSGGIMTLIPLYAHQMLGSPTSLSMWIGLMYSARGIGAAAGPILVKRVFGDSSLVLQSATAAGFFLGAVSILLLGVSPGLWTATVCIGLATFFGSIIWVFSSAMIHMEAEEGYLGRVFSTEMGLLTLVMGISNWAVGFTVDELHLSLREVAFWMAGLFAVPGILWMGFLLFVHNRLKQGKSVGSVSPVDPSGFNPCPTNPLNNPTEGKSGF